MPYVLRHLAYNTRSIRRFRENFRLTPELLTEWADNARVCASAANKQPLRYHVVTEKEECARVFDTLAWAGYLKDWDGPQPGERPTGYLVMACDTAVSEPAAARFDAGIAAQTIMFSASEEGFGGCIILAFNKAQLKQAIDMPEGLEPMLVLALGRPVEDVRLAEIPESGSIEYWRDEAGTHFVPKRSLEDVLF